MDGYAVQAADVAAAAPGAPGHPAGDRRDPGRRHPRPHGRPRHLRPDHDRRADPAGADAVVPVEWTDGGDKRVAISRPAPAGQRDPARPAATWPRATDGGGRRAARPGADRAARGGRSRDGAGPSPAPGRGDRPPATSSPTREPRWRPGQIWESNSYMLAAMARQAGGRARRHRVQDDPVAVVTALEELSCLGRPAGHHRRRQHGRRARRGQGGAARFGTSGSARSPCSPGCRRASALIGPAGRRSSPCPATR